MRIGRTIVIPAILALSLAGAVLAGAENSAVATHPSGAHAQVIAVLELVHRGRNVVDVSAVGALEIDHVESIGPGLNARVAA